MFARRITRSWISVSQVMAGLLLVTAAVWLLTIARLPAHAQSVVTTIPVGDSPWGIAVNAATNRIYVANHGSHDVSIIDGSSDSVLAAVDVNYSPGVLAVNPQTNRIYVANCNLQRLGACVIDGTTDSVIATLGFTVYRDMAVNAQTNRIYAHTISGHDDRITVIDGTTNAILTHIVLGTSQYIEDVAIAINDRTNRIYVTYSGSNALSVIDGATNIVEATVSLAGEPKDIAVNPDTNRIYITSGNEVVVVDGATHSIVDTISGLGVIDDLTVNPRTNRIYVNGISKVQIVDGATSEVEATVTGLPSVWDLAANPETGRLYITHASDDVVTVIQDVTGPAPTTEVPTATPTRTVTVTPSRTVSPTPRVTATPTATLAWTASARCYLPLVVRNYTAPEPPLPLAPPSPVGTMEAGGMAVVDVVNDTPYTLTLRFAGPTQNTTVMDRCEVCRVYSFIGPIFCPTQDRPRTDVYLMPGTYQARVSVDDPAIRDYGGTWSLAGNTKYFLCFYIVRTWGAAD